MQALKWHLDQASKHNEDEYETIQTESSDDGGSETPRDEENQLGIKVSILVLAVALFIAALWLFSRPSFEKCSALEDVTARSACYDQLRSVLLRPPSKGVEFRY
jgi:hypothetical protein